MRVLFHEPDFLEHCLVVALLKHFHSFLSPFDSKLLLVMLPDGSENIGEAALSDKVVLVGFVEVGLIALLGTTT